MYIIGGERVRSRRNRAGCGPRFQIGNLARSKEKARGGSVVIKVKIPALSLQKPERQGQGTLVSKIREKGRASPPAHKEASQGVSITTCSPPLRWVIQSAQRQTPMANELKENGSKFQR